jgi:hypothetical protein
MEVAPPLGAEDDRRLVAQNVGLANSGDGRNGDRHRQHEPLPSASLARLLFRHRLYGECARRVRRSKSGEV